MSEPLHARTQEATARSLAAVARRGAAQHVSRGAARVGHYIVLHERLPPDGYKLLHAVQRQRARAAQLASRPGNSGNPRGATPSCTTIVEIDVWHCETIWNTSDQSDPPRCRRHDRSSTRTRCARSRKLRESSKLGLWNVQICVLSAARASQHLHLVCAFHLRRSGELEVPRLRHARGVS